MKHMYVFLFLASVTGFLLLVGRYGFNLKHGTYGACSVVSELREVRDNRMVAALVQGDSYRILKGYYNCHALEREDLISLKYSSSIPPVVRRVVAVSGDSFEVIKDSQKEGWNIVVNGSKILFNGQPFYFGNQRVPVLKHHSDQNGGKIKDGQGIALTMVPRGSSDSSSFGLISVDMIEGKVIPANDKHSTKPVKSSL